MGAIVLKQLAERTALSTNKANVSNVVDYAERVLMIDETRFTVAHVHKMLDGKAKDIAMDIRLDTAKTSGEHQGDLTNILIKKIEDGKLTCDVYWESPLDSGNFDAEFEFVVSRPKLESGLLAKEIDNEKQFGFGSFELAELNEYRKLNLSDFPGISSLGSNLDLSDTGGMPIDDAIAHLKKEKLNRNQFEILGTHVPSNSVWIALLLAYSVAVCSLIARLRHLTKPSIPAQLESEKEWLYSIGGRFAQALFCISMFCPPVAILWLGVSGVEFFTYKNFAWRIATNLTIILTFVLAFPLASLSIKSYFEFLKKINSNSTSTIFSFEATDNNRQSSEGEAV